MNAIVAIDKNRGIGYKGNLLFKIPEDMKFFVNMTMGGVVVMGRKTFESLPNGKPLTGRVNIVLTKSLIPEPDIITCSSIDSLVIELAKYDRDKIFIIGGQEIYEHLLPYCNTVYITRVENEWDSDKHFPELKRYEFYKYGGRISTYCGMRVYFETHKRFRNNRDI